MVNSINIRNRYLILLLLILFVFPSCNVPLNNSDESQRVANLVNNQVMSYIKQKHPDAAPYIKDDIKWLLSAREQKYGNTGYTFNGDGWILSINMPVTAEEIYSIRADYNSQNISWFGVLNGNRDIIEETYTHTP